MTNALTAATGTANTSNTTLQTAINQAKAALKNLQDAIGEAELENYLPATGTAVAAKKLETAREIALTGAVTGSAEFDGTKGITIITEQNMGKSGNTANTWYKLASLNITSLTNFNIQAVFLISTSYHTSITNFGILRVQLEVSPNPFKINNFILGWDYSGISINLNNFIATYKDSTTPLTIYAKPQLQYGIIYLTLLGYEGSDESGKRKWTTYTNVAENPPSDYTQVPSTYSNLNTGVINSLGLNIRKDPSGTISYPIYFYAGTNGEKLIKINSGQETVNNIVYPTLAIRCSTDNGATWTVIGNFINSDAISKPYDIVTKNYVDTQIASLQAQLASALNLDAATLSVPNEAPTLEAPGEEEITV